MLQWYWWKLIVNCNIKKESLHNNSKNDNVLVFVISQSNKINCYIANQNEKELLISTQILILILSLGIGVSNS